VEISDHIVYILDDDARVRDAVMELLAAAGVTAISFGSAAEYEEFVKPDLPCCLILDVRLPDINGLDFQCRIAETFPLPIIFITGHGDIASSVRAIKAGAVDFLTKPFDGADLRRAIHTALAHDRVARLQRVELENLHKRYLDLTPREREVLPLVVSGLINKVAAAKLGISEITLQIHRSKVMRKMAAKSLPDLVRLAAKLEVSFPRLSSSSNNESRREGRSRSP